MFGDVKVFTDDEMLEAIKITYSVFELHGKIYQVLGADATTWKMKEIMDSDTWKGRV